MTSSFLKVAVGFLTLVNVIFIMGMGFLYQASKPVLHSASGIRSDLDALVSDPEQYFMHHPATYKRFQNLVLNLLVHGAGRVAIENGGLAIDVSADKEFSFLRMYMKRHRKQPAVKFVIDIGSADGILGSNSFNFFQLGWSGMLVDPLSSNMQLADQAVRAATFGTHPNQSIIKEQVAVGDQDRTMEITPFSGNMRSEKNTVLVTSARFDPKGGNTVQMNTVKTLMARHPEISKGLGVLSIDAEGHSWNVLQQFMRLDYRPAFICVEWLGMNKDSMVRTMRKFAYSLLGIIGYNLMFESNDPGAFLPKDLVPGE